MQPYIFPYIGYFQLIYAVEKFVIYDDVTFIKQGWINRNCILVKGEPLIYSVPVSKASQHTLIRDVKIDHVSYDQWRAKFYKTLEQYYRKAPQFEIILQLIKNVFDGEEQFISRIATSSIKAVCTYLSISTELVETAVCYQNSHLKAEDRIIDICRQENKQIYVNAAGGRHLYTHEKFNQNGIGLKFIKCKDISYQQFDYPFILSLSIIDVLMFNKIETIQTMLNLYELDAP
jgi:hypothetical protein